MTWEFEETAVSQQDPLSQSVLAGGSSSTCAKVEKLNLLDNTSNCRSFANRIWHAPRELFAVRQRGLVLRLYCQNKETMYTTVQE